jgi:hypothetical protein
MAKHSKEDWKLFKKLIRARYWLKKQPNAAISADVYNKEPYEITEQEFITMYRAAALKLHEWEADNVNIFLKETFHEILITAIDKLTPNVHLKNLEAFRHRPEYKSKVRKYCRAFKHERPELAEVLL